MDAAIRNKRRTAKAQSLVETVAGLVVLVPVVLALLDIGVLVIAGTISNNLAKQAARAAANTTDEKAADLAVQDAAKQFPASSTFTNAKLSIRDYDPQKGSKAYNYMGSVTVDATVTVVLPVPVPMFNVGPSVNISTQSTEPIVAVPPP